MEQIAEGQNILQYVSFEETVSSSFFGACDLDSILSLRRVSKQCLKNLEKSLYYRELTDMPYDTDMPHDDEIKQNSDNATLFL